MSECKIKRALISVYDKTGIVEFARALVEEFGVEIISTGGTASLLKKEGIPVTLVEEVTGFPEMMDGRIKTLHPKIHAAILADRDNPEHMRQLEAQGIKPIDMVVVNLYPFEKTVADPDCTFEQAIEMIDIGGPCLLRAAAKNHKHVVVVCRANLYKLAMIVLRERGKKPDDIRRRLLAFNAFVRTTEYDAEIAGWASCMSEGKNPSFRSIHLMEDASLRYGENPHQTGSFCIESKARQEPNAHADLLSEVLRLSFNNYADADAALGLSAEITRGLCGSPARETDDTKMCGTGFQPVKCAAGFQPAESAASGFRRIEGETHAKRNLPHIQTPGKIYFVTFRLKEKPDLSPQEREIVFNACLFWHRKKADVHSVVAMPDHVHLLLTPLETTTGKWIPLGEILHSVKRFSAQKINEMRNRTGALWLDESFDRIMRNEKELLETMEYIRINPVKDGLAEEGRYPWYWDDTMPPPDGREADSGRGPIEVPGPAHRMESGATRTSCVFVKHTNACGVGVSGDPVESYRGAYLGDPNAAMGGILACSFAVTADFADAVMDSYARWGKSAGAGGFFVEVWVAPSFDEEAVKVIRTKKKWGERVRLLAVGDMGVAPDPEMDVKKIAGGMLVQSPDLVGLNEDQWKVVTKRAPTEAELADLRLAWLICKHTKSNAITICKNGMLIGNGAGQMSRVMSCRIATWLAKENGHEAKLAGSVAASDAFFPFRDGPDILMDAGVTAIIQPGGSKRDDDTIASCDEHGVAMIHTGTRHFKH